MTAARSPQTQRAFPAFEHTKSALASMVCVAGSCDWVAEPDLYRRGPGQAEALRAGQQMLDRRGMPSRSASWRALPHGFELCGNLMRRAIRRCGLDASDRPDKAIIALLRPGAVQQAGRDNTFVGQPPPAWTSSAPTENFFPPPTTPPFPQK